MKIYDELRFLLLVYLEDILVYSNLTENIGSFMSCTIAPHSCRDVWFSDKCEFLKDHVDYHGFEISSEGFMRHLKM